MAIIKSGATSDNMTVDATSKAARVALYDAGGIALRPSPTSLAMYSVSLKNASTMAASSIAWAMGNIGATGKTIVIPNASVALTFEGTGAVTLVGAEFVKLTGGTAITGGTPVTHTPAKLRTGLSAPVVTVQYYDLTTTLAITSSAVAGVLGSIKAGRVTEAATLAAAVGQLYCDFTMGDKCEGLELAANEWLVLRTLTTGVAGDTFMLNVAAYERA